jgi:type I restriction enzyme, S subunit
MTHTPYPAYRPTDLPWLAQIPAHWEVRRLKFLITTPVTDGPHETPAFIPEGVPFLSVDSIQDGELVFENCRFISHQDHSRYKQKVLPRKGDILLGKSASTGKIAQVKVDFEFSIWSPLALIRLNQAIADPTYVEYVLKSPGLQTEIDFYCNSNTQKNISMQDIPILNCMFPPLPEQRTIASYLDRQTAKIDALIAKKRRLLELLAEQRAALISRAVTKGLPPSPGRRGAGGEIPMKDSGVAWLGQVPGHWEIKKLKLVADLQTGLTLGQKYDSRQTIRRPYLRVANVQDGYLDLADVIEIDIPAEKAVRHELKPGDVLMTEGGDFDKLGRGYVWEGQISQCLHQNHIFVVRPIHTRLDSYFLAALMKSFHGKHYFTSTSQQTTNLATTNATKLKAFPTLLPPIAEQKEILLYLDKQTNRLNGLISKVETAIARLREYRAALISAAVTGKIQVKDEKTDGFTVDSGVIY